MLKCVLDSASIFINNEAAQLSWNNNIEKLRPKKIQSSGADRTSTFI